jgi:hypothetical protein
VLHSTHPRYKRAVVLGHVVRQGVLEPVGDNHRGSNLAVAEPQGCLGTGAAAQNLHRSHKGVVVCSWWGVHGGGNDVAMCTRRKPRA